MSTELAVPEFDDAKIALIKRTYCKDATNDELELFIGQCKRTGLDPIAKQIYFVKRQGKLTIQTGIDGFRLIADRTRLYAGNDDPIFDDEAQPSKATVTVYKLVNGVRCPFTASARWNQYYPGDAQGFMWKKMPHVMLGKCAEALALRKAFPQELSGLYTKDEMDQADRKPAPQSAYADPPDNAEVVSYEQAEEIRGWMAATATDEPTYCKLVKVEAVDVTPAMKYTSIIQSFQAKHARMQKETAK